jgi:type IV pilus assembly protein PilF
VVLHKMEARMKRHLTLFALLLAGTILSAYITTTEGGFTEEASPEKALDQRVTLARQYIRDGNWERATLNLQLAKDIDPNSASVYEAYGLLYQQSGENQLAEEHFKKAIKLDSKCSRCRNNYAAFLFVQERYAEAEKQLGYVVKDTLYPSRPRAFVFLGLCRQKLFDPVGAEEAFRTALTMDRTNQISLLELATIRYDAGDYGTAIQYYDTYKRVARQQSARGLWLGIRLAQAMGDRDAEASYALALTSRYPNSAEYQAYKRTRQSDQ